LRDGGVARGVVVFEKRLRVHSIWWFMQVLNDVGVFGRSTMGVLFGFLGVTGCDIYCVFRFF
jgi:hypothetical protein